MEIQRSGGLVKGSSCTAWYGAKGASSIGRPGFPAERVGETAATELLSEIRGPGEVDSHLSDQLLIYLARYGGSYTASEYHSPCPDDVLAPLPVRVCNFGQAGEGGGFLRMRSVLDSSAFFTAAVFEGELYTTPSVISELRDLSSKARAEPPVRSRPQGGRPGPGICQPGEGDRGREGRGRSPLTY